MTAPGSPEDLYGLPLEEFTAARNALAKELAKSGDKEGAARVKALPKPAKTAWALNQLARRRPELVVQLLDAGKRLRRAQQRALDGDAGGLRDATRAEQEQVGIALDAALELFGGTGPESATADRLRRTLRAAATDPAVGERLKSGSLTADAEPSGFGLDDLSSAGLEALPDGGEEGDDAGEEDGKAADGGRDRQREADRDRQREAEEARARRQAQRDARRHAERLAKKAEAARERADRFREEAERAERRAVEARASADDAEEIAQEAEQFAAAAQAEADRLG